MATQVDFKFLLPKALYDGPKSYGSYNESKSSKQAIMLAVRVNDVKRFAERKSICNFFPLLTAYLYLRQFRGSTRWLFSHK